MNKKTLEPDSYIIPENYPQDIEMILKQIFTEKASANPDLLTINPEKTIGIDQVREIKKFLQIKNWQSKYKAVVIKQAERLTIPAQNALLKTLEEPGKNNFIFLETKAHWLLLPTINSRCQILKNGHSVAKASLELLGKLIDLPVQKRLELLSRSLSSFSPEQKLIKAMTREGQDLLFTAPPDKLKRISDSLSALITAQKMIDAHLSPEQVFDWLALNM